MLRWLCKSRWLKSGCVVARLTTTDQCGHIPGDPFSRVAPYAFPTPLMYHPQMFDVVTNPAQTTPTCFALVWRTMDLVYTLSSWRKDWASPKCTLYTFVHASVSHLL